MELEGYGLVMNAIEIALRIREAITHPLISRYFRVLGADDMIPSEYRQSGFKDYLAPGTTWAHVVHAMREDEFYLDPTRMTLVCGTAGFDGTQFKGLLASEYDIQLNKTSRNSVLLQSNINNTRSDVAQLIRVLVEIARGIESRLASGGGRTRRLRGPRQVAHDRRARPAELQPLPRRVPRRRRQEHPEGDMRSAFFRRPSLCEYVPLFGAECDRRLKEGPEMVSANFVIPYPPGFPIMVPGQVLTQETIDFMRKLDVKEIHGFEKASAEAAGRRRRRQDEALSRGSRRRGFALRRLTLFGTRGKPCLDGSRTHCVNIPRSPSSFPWPSGTSGLYL